MLIAYVRRMPGGLIPLFLWLSLATVSPSAGAPELGEPAPNHPFSPSSSSIGATGPAATVSALASAAPSSPEDALAVAGKSGPSLPLTFFARRAGFEAMAPDFRAFFAPDGVRVTAGGRQLQLRFRGLAISRQPRGENLQPGRGNFLLGDRSENWESGVLLYGALRYGDLYRGIDLLYYGEPGDARLKSDWIVSAGAQPDRIAWDYPDAKRVLIDDDGSLVVETAGGILREHRPVAYQDMLGGRRTVAVRYRLRQTGAGQTELGFALGPYDRTVPLVIDPVLSYSTYLGGTKNDVATAISLDGTGGVYVAGYTESGDMPSLPGVQPFAGSVDAYVFHFNAGATQLIYATFVGGGGDDRAYGIDIDSSGNAYVVGSTLSTNFPKYAPLQQSLAGTRDAFIFKLNAAGSALVYSTYFGGSDSETAYAVSVDPFGQPYVAGETASVDFPVKAAFQSTNHGGYDAFTFKLNMNGALVYSTYIGGSGNDGARGIAVSTNQLTAYLTGYTWSADFPLWNPAQASLGGGEDAFLVRFNSDANGLVFSTYLGGSGGSAAAPEIGLAVSTDPFNNVYAVGTTSSTDFPVLNAYQATNHGGQDAWLRKIDSGGVLVYSTYLGGIGTDIANAVRVDALRRPYVVGYTSSVDFPLMQAAQATFGGVYDAFVSEFEYTGLTLVASTYLGGSGADVAYGVAVDSTNGDTYVAGSTGSTNFPTQAAFRFTNAGLIDAFVAKLTANNVPPTPPAFISLTPNQGSGSSVTFNVVVADANGANDIDSTQILVNSHFTGVSSCHAAYVPSTNLFYLLNDNATAFLGGLPPGTATAIHNSQCLLNIAAATAVHLGNVITLQFPITFASSDHGTKLIYMLAVDKEGLRADWASYGIWTSP